MTTGFQVTLAGGWGYDNLGDEAILAGYLELFRGRADVEVLSVDPGKTATAQLPGVVVSSEYRSGRRSSPGSLLVCGGGYINGHWRTELPLKLRRLDRVATRADHIATHGVELRKLDSRLVAPVARRLLSRGPLAVRDDQSRAAAEELGLERPDILPDSISLLAPHIDRYVRPLGVSTGKVLINVLDIAARPDASESEIDTQHWRSFCEEIVAELGDRALGLVAGEGDSAMLNALGLPTVTVRSVSALVSTIAEADAMLSVRMHPTLLGTILGTPTVGIPYTGKVRPTLKRIGVDDVLIDSLATSDAIRRLRAGRVRWDAQWREASAKNKAWIDERIGLEGRTAP